jgi:hypothetical protein
VDTQPAPCAENLNGGAPAADAEDMKRFTALLVTLAALAVPASAAAHMPGTDGGPAQRGCQPVNDFGTYVGATRVSCSLARQVAAGVTRGQSFARWRCTWQPGEGSGTATDGAFAAARSCIGRSTTNPAASRPGRREHQTLAPATRAVAVRPRAISELALRPPPPSPADVRVSLRSGRAL